jgi:predicted phage-related endonuclease
MSAVLQDLGDRRTYLGGSELAAILGLSKFATPLDVYLRKVDGAPTSEEETLNQAVGHALEPVLRREYQARNGIPIEQPPEVVLDGFPFIRCHLDGRARDRVWEGKTAALSTDWGEAGTDAIAEYYLPQVQVYAAAIQVVRWDVSVIFSGRSYAEYTGRRDDELVRMILEAARDFWGRVERRDPPAPLTYDDVKKRWPRDNGLTVEATPEIERYAHALAETKAALKVIEETKDEQQGEIQRYMGEAATLLSLEDGKPLATWKAAKGSTKTDWQALADEALKTMPPAMREELLARHTYTTAGGRRFLLKIKGE